MSDRRARDLELLDYLDALPRAPFEGEVWRIVRAERDVLQGYPARGRWDPGTFDVLYTSLAREGALEEIHFHLSRQPVFPSKMQSVLHRLSVRTRRTLRLGQDELNHLGVGEETYSMLAYGRTQEIGDAVQFLGCDALIAPSARWACDNLVLFTDALDPEDLASVGSEPVDWAAWRAVRREARSGRVRLPRG